MWERFLQSDNLVAPVSKTTFYRYDAWGNRNGSSSASLVGNIANLGSKRVSYLMKTKFPRKGHVGFLPQNPALHYKIEVDCDNAVAELYYKTAGKMVVNRIVSGTLPGFAAEHPLGYLSVPATDSGAISVLVTAIARSKEASTDVGMMIAESGETLDMLRSPFQFLSSPKGLPSLVPRKTTRLIGSALQYATNAWLTARYGIIPCLSDIDSIRTRVQEGFDKPHFGRSKAKRSVVSLSTTSKVNGGTNSNCWWTGTRSTKIEQRYVARAFFSSYLSYAAQLGLDASSIIPTMYELIPYSFVLDWFVDVGSWLRAIWPKPGIQELGNYLSVSQVRTDEVDVWGYCASPTVSAEWPLTACPGKCTCTSIAYDRTVNIPTPTYPLVSVDLTSWKRKLDGVSLLFQRLPKLPRR